MDTEFPVDLAEIKRSFDAVDVTSLYFPFLGKTLLMDWRCNENDGPMVRVVPQVASSEQRLRSLRRLRPRFPRPDGLSLIPWPRLVQSLVALGVWDHIMARCNAAATPGLAHTCERCLIELRAIEALELRNAVNGEGYESLWPHKH